MRKILIAVLALLLTGVAYLALRAPEPVPLPIVMGDAAVHTGAHDVSPALATIATGELREPANAQDPDRRHRRADAMSPPDDADDAETALQARDADARIVITSPRGGDAVEQTSVGTRPAARLVSVIEGPGTGFVGPQGNGRGGLDYSLAVGPNHIFAIVNGGGIHIWSKRGLPDPKTKKPMFDTSGTPLYGPVNVRTLWKGFGGQCDTRGSGDAVVRYDQLADRWLVVVPLFSRYPHIEGQQPYPEIGVSTENRKGQRGQPGAPAKLDVPDTAGNGRRGAPPVRDTAGRGARGAARSNAGDTTGRGRPPVPPRYPDGTPPPGDTTVGTYGICYAVSTTSDPLGTYYRYEFVRPYFPDYPRPAIWPDGYYVATSTSDNFIQKHACVADRASMLKGEDATEQCIVINGIPFLNMADIDGKTLPPRGAPIPVLAAGGSQLRGCAHRLGDLFVEFPRRLERSEADGADWTGADSRGTIPFPL